MDEAQTAWVIGNGEGVYALVQFEKHDEGIWKKDIFYYKDICLARFYRTKRHAQQFIENFNLKGFKPIQIEIKPIV